MKQDSTNLTHNSYLVLKTLADPANEGIGLSNTTVIERTGLSKAHFWQVHSFLLGNGYAEGTLGGLNGSMWATGKGLEFLEGLNEEKRKRAAEQSREFSGLIHKIAVLGKDYYTIATIGDLFIFAGAASNWWQQPEQTYSSERITEVYGWIEGIMAYAPASVEKIVQGVALQLSENEEIPEREKALLQRFVRMPGHSAYDAGQENSVFVMPSNVERLLEVAIQNLPRAILPLEHRRQGLTAISFDNEYDIQDLLHAMLRPWVKDIRPEEYTPSYVGSSTRIDFLLAAYDIMIEVKYVRDKGHAKKIGDELIIDIAHYAEHPGAKQLWIAVYDPGRQISNPEGIISQLNGEHVRQNKRIRVRTFIL